MARRSSVKSLKDERPFWYCIAQHFGTVADLAQTGKKLIYITDPREIADIWKIVGNPKFRNEYAYLLISETIISNVYELNEVYAVKLPAPHEEAEKGKRRRRRVDSRLTAFEGHVDKICYGWTTKSHAKHIEETGHCCTGDVPHKEFEI
jgi:hypothetical protein